jgi:hypothetical protein
MRPHLAAACSLVVLLAGPSAARAADPGVTFDGGGPADKEYAVPLDAARTLSTGQDERDAASPATARASAAPPIFGEGIRPAAGRANRDGASRRASGAAARSGPATRPGATGIVSAGPTRVRAAEPALSGGQVMAGTAMAVLLLGGGAGATALIARRRQA